MVCLCDVIVGFHVHAIYGGGGDGCDSRFRGCDCFRVAGKFKESFGLVCVENWVEGIEGDAGEWSVR